MKYNDCLQGKGRRIKQTYCWIAVFLKTQLIVNIYVARKCSCSTFQ